MSEQWRPVIGFADYEVSDQGRVRRDERVLKPWVGPMGRPTVTLSVKGRPTTARVDELQAAAFAEVKA